jgi:HAMP domain-containing protein
MARHLLYFTAEDHYLYTARGGKLVLEAKFPGDDLGVGAFREHLRGHKGALFAVVADLAGEDFHEDQVPLLRRGDREAVVQRRLAQRYRDTRLAAALSLGTVSGPQRRNERLLLASFTNTQQFAPWLDALAEARARLAGVYSVPLLAPALAARLGLRGPRALVVTANRAGLRQCFVEDGRLRFARLERTVEMVPQALAAFARSETLRLAQYLATLRALPRDSGPLTALVVAPPGERATFEQTLVSDARVTFQTIDHARALDAVRLRHSPEGSAAEALYVQLAAHKPPREQFASSDDRRRYTVWQLQRAVVAAGALGFAACALYAGARWYDAQDLRARAADQVAEGRSAAERYQRITAAFPVTDTTTENLRTAVLEFRRIADASAQPESAFIHVSRVLEQFPQVELDAINWRAGKPGELPAENRGGGAKPAARGEQGLQFEVTGRVNATQRNDYRAITAQVQSFAHALASGRYQLVRTQLPFDVTSEGTLTGDIGGRGDSGEAPRFTITLGHPLP